MQPYSINCFYCILLGTFKSDFRTLGYSFETPIIFMILIVNLN